MEIKNPELYSYLDISTAHITKEDGELLQKHGKDTLDQRKALTGPIVYDYGYGSFVSVGAEGCDRYNDYSQAFRDIMEFARSRGCFFVRFDGDGAEYEELPTFEW